jgi:hypothetical protein
MIPNAKNRVATHDQPRSNTIAPHEQIKSATHNYRKFELEDAEGYLMGG